MAYCTQADIVLQLPEATLGQLTNDTGAGTVVTANVDRAIANADAMIDGYIRGKNTTGSAQTAATIRLHSVNLSIYYVYARRMSDNMPEAVMASFNAAESWLKAVRDNKVLIDDATSSANTAAYMKVSKEASDQVFTDTVLKGYR